jgi:tetratricopeptide (TPR) repeat protein
MSVLSAHRSKSSGNWKAAAPHQGRASSGVRPRRRPSSGVLDAVALVDTGADARALLRRGDGYLRGDDAAQATPLYARALTMMKAAGDPELKNAYLRLGHANRALGRTLPAVQSYRAALELDAAHVPTLEGLISLHAWHGEWSFVQRYEQRLFKALRDEPRLLDVLLASGDRWLEQGGDAERAHVRFMIAHKRFPDSDKARQRSRDAASEHAPATVRSPGAYSLVR